MGNSSSSTQVIRPSDLVGISTRHQPPPGKKVVQELGLISATVYSQERDELPALVTANASDECAKLGGNFLISAQTQISLRNSSNFSDFVHLLATCVKTTKDE